TIVFHNKKGFSTEIEVSRFRYSSEYIKKYNYNDSTHKVENVLSEGRNKQFELFIRYEYKQTLFAKKEWKRFKPLIGLSATPFVQCTKFEPRISTAYASSKLSVGIFISLIPRIEYTL